MYDIINIIEDLRDFSCTVVSADDKFVINAMLKENYKFEYLKQMV
jgi:hypothetical protein